MVLLGLILVRFYFSYDLLGPIFRYSFKYFILDRLNFCYFVFFLGVDFLFLVGFGLYLVWFYFGFYFGSTSFPVVVNLFWLRFAWAFYFRFYFGSA
jgi:hypothetical protein